ncbi:MAG: hypothetical protein A2020_05835 [Lentisphaerae bacterium GWF2_45_14]|nr:MAG: hypothetical protein A2020_05835 [Lentisphaerae bacterium GWF2_45_14]
MRLDLFLSGRFTYNSRSRWQEAVSDGLILVNGSRCRSSRLMRAGDVVAFTPEFDEPEVDPSFNIIYRDEHILIVDKSGNLPCHPAGAYFKNTLWHLLRTSYGNVSIVNRLDRETSGLTIAAFSSEAAKRFSALFDSGEIIKKYTALVFGKFENEVDAEGFLVQDLSSEVRKKRRFMRTVAAGTAGAEYCRTFLRPMKTDGKISLVEAVPFTGRLHQIRATLFSLGFPLLGDKLYGPDDGIYLRFINDSMTDKDRALLMLKRQALHAKYLEFIHPFSGEKCIFESSFPSDLILS